MSNGRLQTLRHCRLINLDSSWITGFRALSILGKIGCDRRISFSFKDLKGNGVGWGSWHHSPGSQAIGWSMLGCQKLWQMLIGSDFEEAQTDQKWWFSIFSKWDYRCLLCPLNLGVSEIPGVWSCSRSFPVPMAVSIGSTWIWRGVLGCGGCGGCKWK